MTGRSATDTRSFRIDEDRVAYFRLDIRSPHGIMRHDPLASPFRAMPEQRKTDGMAKRWGNRD